MLSPKSFPPIILSLLIFFSNTNGQDIIVDNLRVNHFSHPLGLEESPDLSWQIKGGEDIQQASYQILVASSQEKLKEGSTDLWDSGKIPSSQSVHLPYQGKSLGSGQRAYWKVKVWDKKDRASSFSNTAWWEMGLLEAEDWQGQWISPIPPSEMVPPALPSPYFRKEFLVEQPLKSARLYVSGLGYFEAFINGKKVGDHVLDPMITRYDKRVKYLVFDVKEQIQSSNNAIGVVLGNGWYNQHTRTAWDFDKAPWRESPSLRCQLVLEDESGKVQVISTDETWKYSYGPIVFNGIHNGETYDARLELGSWAEPQYENSNWKPAMEVPGPKGKMSSQLMPPIRVIDRLQPVETWQVNDSVMMVDLGQNLTGWANIKVKGPKGSRIKLRYGERIYEDSTLDIQELSRFIWTGDTQTDRYILKGEGEENWHPLFTYHGFQFIEVTLSDPAIELTDIVAEVVHSDLPTKGYFRSSNEMFNQLQENIRWSFLGNYHGYPTDCPHREKMGWTGDALLVAETGLFNFDMAAAYLKWLDDFIDEQRESGDLPGIIPTSGWGYTFGKKENRERGYGPQWEGAFMEIPWQLYRFTSDTTILQKYYPNFRQYVQYLRDHSEGNLLNFGIDDHKQLTPLTQEDYLSSAFYYYLTEMLGEMAGILGKAEEAKRLNDLSGKIKHAFNDRYYDHENGIYDHGGQTPMALALYFGLVEEKEEAKVLQNLMAAIQKSNGHIDAGVVGTKMVINTLMEYGQERVLYEMADKRDFPGWGYWIDELGATTLFQNWDGSQSRNHIMFGSIGDYFFKGLAGIQIKDSHPGFRHFQIKPQFDNGLKWIEAAYQSPYGQIISHWKKEENQIAMEVSIPANSRADIFLPTECASTVFVNGEKLQESLITSHQDRSGDFLVFTLGSGDFEIQLGTTDR